MFMFGAEHPELLLPAERIRFTWAVYEMLGNGEFMFHQWHAAATRLEALAGDAWLVDVTSRNSRLVALKSNAFFKRLRSVL
jgi:hypothetical protein